MLIKAWTGKIRNDFEVKLRDEKFHSMRELICAMSLCDEKGELLFDYKSQKDLEVLSEKHSGVLDYISAQASDHQKITEKK